MEGEIDLDQLIKEDKSHRHRTHKIHKNNQQKKTFNQRKPHYHQKQQHQDIPKQQQEQKNITQGNEKIETSENLIKGKKVGMQNGYSILVTGFVSDVSSQDIYNLAGNRKILSIKTILKGNDNGIINENNMKMEVFLTFVEKEDTDSFIKQYSDKKLDGKHSLTFQYRRSY